jgi:dihydropteroate synthase
LAQKERAQPFGLKILAGELERFCSLRFAKKIEVMGIINANEDSFYPNSRFNVSTALGAVEEMIFQGADIIDIGGVSSRPNSMSVSVSEELDRLKPIVDLLYEQKVHEKIRLSLDSYAPAVIAYALERGFSIVNDITGFANDAVVQLCGEFKATAVIMHAQGTPQTMQNNPYYENVLYEVEQFFQERLEKADTFGVTDVILDCGIGFGKRLEDNLALIAHQKHFCSLGKPLLVGASRKSMIDTICTSTTQERLGGTLAIHLRAIAEGASMVRVHDVAQHVQAIAVWQALGEL